VQIINQMLKSQKAAAITIAKEKYDSIPSDPPGIPFKDNTASLK
jgi:hypothetical protein